MTIGGTPIIDTGTRPDGQPRTVLVVEDEVLLRFVICEVLREAGFEVVEAGNAEEALSYLATAEPVDAVFSDVRMPGRLNGLALAEQIAGLYPGLPVMLTSGDHGAQASASVFRFFAKPYNPYHVSAVLAETLRANRGDHGRDGDLYPDR